MKTRNRYTLNYFINKFKKIPASRWTTGTFGYNGKKCALGHCRGRHGDTFTLSSRALQNLVPDIISVNDDGFNAYQAYGKTPKTRVLNYLKELAKQKNG